MNAQLKVVMDADASVKRCIATAPSSEGRYYFIETTHATFPKFVVGEWRAKDGACRQLLQCGLESNAQSYWERLTDLTAPPEKPCNCDACQSGEGH